MGEHRGTLLVMLVGFGFVGFVLIKLASQIDTNPKLQHYIPPPTATPSESEPAAAAVPTTDPGGIRRQLDLADSTRELLVDVAARQYASRVPLHARHANPWLSDNADCALVARGPAKEKPPFPRRVERREGETTALYSGTFRCLSGNQGAIVTIYVDLLHTGERWEIDPDTQKILDEDGPLPTRERMMTSEEMQKLPTPVALPTVGLPRGLR